MAPSDDRLQTLKCTRWYMSKMKQMVAPMARRSCMAACTRGGMWDMWWEALRAEMLEAMAHTKERVAYKKTL